MTTATDAESVSPRAAEAVGTVTEFCDEFDTIHRDVTILAVERTGTTIQGRGGQRWPGIRFRIRLAGGHERWTITFPDMDLASATP